MLNQLSPVKGSRTSRKRIARGRGGKGGTTAGKGTKGQQSRTGKGRRFTFEGGQTPLLRRQPKLSGFKNPRRKEFEVVNIATLEADLPAGSYNVAALREKGVVRTKKPVRLLARGEVKKKFTLEVNAASKSAVTAIEKAGGKITILPR